MSASSTHEVYETLQRERDLYWRLLELGTKEDLVPFLEEALALIVEVTSSKKGYLALHAEDSDTPRWSIARGVSEEELWQIRQTISQGIIASAMATGQTILTDSALNDPRFQEHQSVLSYQIGPVLCAPIGGDQAIGVLYLQDREQGVPFSIEDQKRAEAFARHLAPFADRLRTRAQENEENDKTKPYRNKLRLEGLIGKSEALATIFGQLESAARFEIPVLLTGPSGTGKTALARAIHDNSARAQKPFIELNCAALPEGLFESELFGATAGAHSTATRTIPGKVSAAQGGTLFLDEIGELSLGVQSKLLQFLQSQEYFPLGASRAQKADVRLIAATNANLQQAISQKEFREDLYYRLNVLTIRACSLSERKEDIPLLIQHFCQKTCQQYGLPVLGISPAALRAVEVSDWPGNIRELSHAIVAATVRAATENASTIERKHLFTDGEKEQETDNEALTYQEATRRFQKELLQKTLQEASWNISETARRLDLARSYVHTLIQAYELRRDT